MEDVINSIKYFKERNYKEDSLHVGDIEWLCLKLGVKYNKKERPTGAILYGLKIVEKDYVPADRAYLVDKTGKIIKIFNTK